MFSLAQRPACMTAARAAVLAATAAVVVMFAVAVMPTVAAAAAATTAAPDAARGADGLLVVPPAAPITDTAGALTAADLASLQAKLAAFEAAHASQLAVLLVRSTLPEPIEDFAHRVGEAWKIGRKGVGDGVLLVAAIDDRRLRIDVARALEGAIPDAIAKRIIRERIAPRFQQNDIAGGVSAGLDALFKQIEGEGLPTPAGMPQAKVQGSEDVLGLLIPFVVVGVLVAALLRRVIGVPGALLGGGGAGAVAGWSLSSLALGGLAGVAVFILALIFGAARSGRTLGGSRGPVFIPGGWGGGGGLGGRGGGGGGGWTSGGGGDFSGGGASGDW